MLLASSSWGVGIIILVLVWIVGAFFFSDQGPLR